MTLFPAKMPGLLKKFFPNYVWDFFSERHLSPDKNLYLTIDDGPMPEISEFILDELAKYGAKATFFCVGSNVQRYPHIFNKIIEQGHAIGNHTQHHLKGTDVSTAEYISDILETEKVLNAYPEVLNGKHKKLFRPPFGRIKRSQAKKIRAMGYKIIMWDVIAKDWISSISNEECLDNVISKASNGSIVVFHDSIKAATKLHFVLPKVLEHFSRQGYKFRKIEF